MPARRPDLILAIDVGTTSVKAAVVDEAGEVVATGVAGQRIGSDASGRRDHDADGTWRAVRRAVERLWTAVPSDAAPAATRVRAIVVTGPRGSFGIAGADGRPRGPMITWQDRRAAGIVPDLARRAGPRQRRITGYELTPSAVLPKLIWLQRTQPGLFGDGWHVLTPQGDILRRLGVDGSVVDLSVAGLIGLLDLSTMDWSETLLRSWGVPRQALPELVPQGAVVGRISAAAARQLALSDGIPLVAAGSDGVCSELGAGVVAVGQIYGYLGTAGAVAGPLTEMPTNIDRALIVMPGSTPHRRRILGLIGSGGSARDWAMATLGVRDHARFDRMAARSPAGARGVLFLATLAGASAPEPDGRARGMLLGLSLATGPDDVARATLEGVALEMRAIVDAMTTAMPMPTAIALTGGGSRSSLWAGILADVVQLPVHRVHEPNPGLRGAAQYGLTVLGRYATVVEAAIDLPPSTERFLPDPALAERYRQAAGLYAQVRRSSHRDGIDALVFEPTSVPADG